VKALVIGAGIAGLSAAIALRRAGHDVVVFERAHRLEEIGAGIALSANALNAFEALDLAEAVRAHGAEARRLVLRTWRGDVLTRLELEPGRESVGIHRGRLQNVLLRALSAEDVRLGRRCVAFVQDRTGVTAQFADGAEERGDALVGADGIHSAIRETLFGPERPRYAGYAGWRATAQLEPELFPRGEFWESWGCGVRVGLVDIGQGEVYWFVSETVPERATPPDRPKTVFLERFRAWHEPIQAAMAATDENRITRTLIYDRTPIRRWGEGRVTLVGDAAHPMTPNLGQGACQAVEDAAVLGWTCEEKPDVVAALRQYEARRLRRANAVAGLSWRTGRFAQAQDVRVCRLRDAIMRLTPTRVQLAQQRRLARFTT
jgi:2-polyprenyl-6-methoxyphenol hydroxylase-like FAD-dependent oxidoreductase